MKNKDKIIVHVDLTRAEELTKAQQEELGIKKGLVILEHYLSEKELKTEFDQIITALKKSKKKAFMQYILFMRNSISFAIKKSKMQK